MQFEVFDIMTNVVYGQFIDMQYADMFIAIMQNIGPEQGNLQVRPIRKIYKAVYR